MSSNSTQLLRRWNDGDEDARDQLVSIIYKELKRRAHALRRGERTDHTFNTTALVHEAYLKLIDVNRIQWRDRAHFLAMASLEMHRILIDYAKQRNAKKRGGDWERVPLKEDRLMTDNNAETLLELEDALHQFEKRYPRIADAVIMKNFGGLKHEEIGIALDVSPATVTRDLRFGYTWLRRLLSENAGSRVIRK